MQIVTPSGVIEQGKLYKMNIGGIQVWGRVVEPSNFYFFTIEYFESEHFQYSTKRLHKIKNVPRKDLQIIWK